MEFVYFDYLVLPLLIFFARIADVSIGTIRIIFVNKGHKNIAPILGFFEVLIWVTVMGRLMKSMDNMWLYVAYALGFSAGTYVGMFLEEKLCFGKVMVRLVVKKDSKALLKNLKKDDYPLTITDAESGREMIKVMVILSIISRKRVKRFLEIVNETNPNAFYSIEDMRGVREGNIISKKSKQSFNLVSKRK